MQISEIKIVPIEGSTNGLVGFASFVFENAFYLGSIGIFTRPNGGYRLTYPMRKNTTDRLNFFYPINKEIADQIEQEVISKFKEVILIKKQK